MEPQKLESNSLNYNYPGDLKIHKVHIQITSLRRISHMIRDCIFLTAVSMADTFFLRADHCSSVNDIPEDTTVQVLKVET